MKEYTCVKCGNKTDDEVEFETDIENEVDEDEMVCENCYDGVS